jgi:cytochrome oxidase Cu insertion factor (SCO1/SenC/PrrC family)
MKMRRRIALILVALLLSGWLSGCMGGADDEIEYNGIEYREPPDAPDFTLLDQNGEEFTLSDLEGKVVVVAFIYTTCPDICLAISANMAWAQENLGDASDDVVFLSVTIDPARDTVARLSEWTEAMGYDWTHLTAERTSTLVSLYSSWNIIVDNAHIEASTPTEGAMNRVIILDAENNTTVIDHLNSELSIGATVGELDEQARAAVEVELSSDTSWNLMSWNKSSWAWELAADGYLDEVASHDDHLAWVADGADASLLPVGVDCNGHGWVMGDGSGAHCMCDEGYERPDGDALMCVAEGSVEAEQNDPHGDSLGEYEVGHSTVTFILDKQLRKRIAWTGTAWDLDGFVEDLQNLAAE